MQVFIIQNVHVSSSQTHIFNNSNLYRIYVSLNGGTLYYAIQTLTQ